MKNKDQSKYRERDWRRGKKESKDERKDTSGAGA
jgi:hypothetical protein